MTQRPVHLSIADAQIISELLDDLESQAGQLRLLDGKHQLAIEEARAVRRLRDEILHALGVRDAKGGRP
ncbi:MAG TPA: hypothetical protein VLL25_16000 [Acidimicrobiales bacterium]|nr:hypothetical protein [Acidimicrobiales bacterium]